MMQTNSQPYSESSWGETLQNYRKNSSSLPWKEGEFQPTDRVTTYQKSRQEREFNPVLMRFRDTARESTVSQRERAFAAVRLNEAKDKQLCFEQKFDIINHKSHLPQRFADSSKQAKLMENARRKAPDSRVKYNIISHMGHDEHFGSKMVPPEGEEVREHSDPQKYLLFSTNRSLFTHSLTHFSLTHSLTHSLTLRSSF